MIYLDNKEYGEIVYGGKYYTTDEITINNNGVYNATGVDGYNKITVNVPTTTPKLEEKSIDIIENGTTTITPSAGNDGLSSATINVNVPQNLEELTATENKVYTPTSGKNGFSKVTVNVPQSGGDLDWASIGFSKRPSAIDDGVAYAQTIQANWQPKEYLYEKCANDKQLMFFPSVDTSIATNTAGMFSGCTSLIAVADINTSKVTDMNNMFYECHSLTAIPNLDTYNVTDMNHMFAFCHHLPNIPQLNTYKVTNMNSMFYGCTSLTAIPNLDTSNVTNMNTTFGECKNLTSIELGDISKVTDMSAMFYGCSKLNKIVIDKAPTNLTSVTNMCDGLPTTGELIYGNSDYAAGRLKKIIAELNKDGRNWKLTGTGLDNPPAGDLDPFDPDAGNNDWF